MGSVDGRTWVMRNLVRRSGSRPFSLDRIISSMSPCSFSITTNTFSGVSNMHSRFTIPGCRRLWSGVRGGVVVRAQVTHKLRMPEGKPREQVYDKPGEGSSLTEQLVPWGWHRGRGGGFPQAQIEPPPCTTRCRRTLTSCNSSEGPGLREGECREMGRISVHLFQICASSLFPQPWPGPTPSLPPRSPPASSLGAGLQSHPFPPTLRWQPERSF